MTVDSKLLEVLACPMCHGSVADKEEKIVCTDCGRQYPVKDGILVMLPQDENKNS